MFYFEHRTLETTKSACVIPEEYTKFATLAEAKAALLQLGHNKYAKVTKPKENLCIFFGPFQSIQSQALRQVLCGGTPHDLLEPTKYFRQVVGPPSSKGYIANNWTTYLRRLEYWVDICLKNYKLVQLLTRLGMRVLILLTMTGFSIRHFICETYFGKPILSDLHFLY